MSSEPKSSLHWSGGVGSGWEEGLNSQGNLGVAWAALLNPTSQPSLPSASLASSEMPLAFTERIRPGKPGQRLFYGEQTAFLKGGVAEITS